jgi:rod shape-determining protein MreD
VKRTIVVTVLIIFCFLLQSTVFHAVAFGGIVPNLLIVLAASFGFMRGEKTGLVIGFFCGLLMDIFFGEVIGFYALLYMYAGYANGKFNHIFFPEDVKLPIALIICSDFCYSLVCYVLMFLMRTRFHFGHYFLYVILPEIVYTIVVTIFLYPVILWINRKLEDSEKRSAKKFV